MKTLGFFGRIIFAVSFIVFGIFHFINTGSMADKFLDKWIIPAPVIYISGFALILVGISIIIKVQAKIACLFLALYLMVIIVTIHVPQIAGGDQVTITNLLKDLALLGASLTYANILAK